MALTVSVSRTDTVGRYTKYVTGTITFDSSYATGGEAIAATDMKLSSKIEFLQASSAAGYIFEYDATNGKVKAYWPNSDATAPSVAKQVASTTDLSAVTCNFIAFGY